MVKVYFYLEYENRIKTLSMVWGCSVQLVRGWCGVGAGLVRGWCGVGAGLVRGWCGVGAGLVRG